MRQRLTPSSVGRLRRLIGRRARCAFQQLWKDWCHEVELWHRTRTPDDAISKFGQALQFVFSTGEEGLTLEGTYPAYSVFGNVRLRKILQAAHSDCRGMKESSQRSIMDLSPFLPKLRREFRHNRSDVERFLTDIWRQALQPFIWSTAWGIKPELEYEERYALARLAYRLSLAFDPPEELSRRIQEPATSEAKIVDLAAHRRQAA